MQTYLEQTKNRHVIVAISAGDSTAGGTQEATASLVYARWQYNGIKHADLIKSDYAVKAGEPVQLWVDAKGKPVDQPTPIARAGPEAVAAAAVAWGVVVLAAMQVVGIVRAHTKRMRDAQWEHEIRCLVDDDGRTNRSQ